MSIDYLLQTLIKFVRVFFRQLCLAAISAHVMNCSMIVAIYTTVTIAVLKFKIYNLIYMFSSSFIKPVQISPCIPERTVRHILDRLHNSHKLHKTQNKYLYICLKTVYLLVSRDFLLLKSACRHPTSIPKWLQRVRKYLRYIFESDCNWCWLHKCIPGTPR